jgi:hypothetical protein
MSIIINYPNNTDHIWLRLPIEIRQQILLQLDAAELIRLLHVCKEFYSVIKIDCLIWRQLFRRSFPACAAEEDWMTWRFAGALSSNEHHIEQLPSVATEARDYSHNNNTWKLSPYKHSHIDWWQLFWERVQLERNWRQGCFAINSISLPTNFNEQI